MNKFREAIRNWFGYSRRERRSTFILLNIIALLICIRHFYPFNEQAVKEIPVELLESADTFSASREKTSRVTATDSYISSKQRIKKELLNLNTCDSADLEALPGIGPVLAARILKYRNLIGGYVSPEQLKEVYGLPPETYDLISKRVRADSLLVRRIKINEAGFKDLIRHPYLQRNEVNAIIKYRELEGIIPGIDLMVENKLISPETAKRIRAYLEF